MLLRDLVSRTKSQYRTISDCSCRRKRIKGGRGNWGVGCRVVRRGQIKKRQGSKKRKKEIAQRRETSGRDREIVKQ